MDEEFGEFVFIGAEPVEGAVVPAHAAVDAILAAKVGDLDHAANENLVTKHLAPCLTGFFVQQRFGAPTRMEVSDGRKKSR